MDKTYKKKVIFASSSGGHLEELLRLEPLFNKYDYLVVTEKTPTTEKMKNDYNMSYMIYGSRKYLFKYIFVFLFNVLKSIYLILNFNPNTIVSTGAHTGGIVCFIGKIFRKKIIYIETLAKVKTLSMTGEKMYKIADKFYVQWEELIQKYPKAEYIGRLI